MFDTVLIANRGEIACRIALSCRRLGIRTVAIFSEADSNARHVSLCDEAWLIGPAPARESYLRMDRILDIARKSNAQAIHPGYGFLSENADFAQACQAAGLTFIGPPADAIRAMGSKSAAKNIMQRAGVPLIPGYHGDDQSPVILSDAADEIGYPVLIKASSGGGGKGMRIVEKPSALQDAISSAKREAASAFGDDQLLIEKYLIRPRHIEMQVFADQQGNVLHLFERDCSIQRRHQKVIEEAPAPGMTPQRREQMASAAVAAARAIGYVNAGTVEFIVAEDQSFYFMEMNTRLQVEHPVTEMITGQDLVEWQLRVAFGEPLPLQQNHLSVHGHAFEARIYAEDPDRDFLPATGHLRYLRAPEETTYVRIDTGIRQGDEVGIHYDPMIAKLVVWDRDRSNALRRLRRALNHYQVVGLSTNLRFLQALASHPALAAGELDTDFIPRHRQALFPVKRPAADTVLAIASLNELLRIQRDAASNAARSSDPWSPWHSTIGWRLNADNHHMLHIRDGDREVSIIAHFRPGAFLLELPNGHIEARGDLDAQGIMDVDLDGVREVATVVRQGEHLTVFTATATHELVLYDPQMAGMEDQVTDGALTAPMPGTVLQVFVSPNDRVATGAPLMILEAMKMEHTIVAPSDGVIERVEYGVGDQVQEGCELLTLVALEHGDEN